MLICNSNDQMAWMTVYVREYELEDMSSLNLMATIQHRAESDFNQLKCV